MDYIFLEALKFEIIIGCLTHERVQKQPIFLDLKLYFDFSAAHRSDQLADTVDYADLVASLGEYLASTRFQLIETLAEMICEWLFSHYPLQKIHLTLRKPQAIANASTVGISIERVADVVA